MSTTTEIAPAPGQALALSASIDYARALAPSNLLPVDYRGRPANVLWAVEFGRTINITPMAAITGVHVIEGKPSASAGLMSGLVRRAGHRLRVRVTGTVAGGDITAVCTITRSDDPDYPFEAAWDLHRAVRAGLIDRLVVDEAGRTVVVSRTPKGKPSSWEKYPEAMLKARCVSEAARDACEEILFGLHYTPEELGAEVDADGEVIVGSWTENDQPATTGTEPAVREMAEQDVARQWQQYACNEAREAARSSSLEELRAPFRDAPKEALDADVSGEITGPERVAVLMYDDRVLAEGPLPLRTWLIGCAAHLDQGGGMSVTEAVTASADVVGAEVEDPPTP